MQAKLVVSRLRLVVFAIILVLSIQLVSSVSKDDYLPKAYQGWDNRNNSLLDTFWHNLDPFLEPSYEISPEENADKYGWYNKTFFRLANWEREVCLFDLSSNIRNIRDIVTDTSPMIYTTTITLTALKQDSIANINLYEVSWYYMPFDYDAEYRVLLQNNESKEFIAGTATKWLDASTRTGANGYEAKYLNASYTSAVLQYKDKGSSTVNNFTRMII